MNDKEWYKKYREKFSLDDSGNRIEFTNNINSDQTPIREPDTNKIQYDLLPPEVLRRLCALLSIGAEKYSRNNWKNGISDERFLRSALRHLNQYRLNQNDEDHLSQAIFNLIGILYNEEVKLSGRRNRKEKIYKKNTSNDN